MDTEPYPDENGAGEMDDALFEALGSAPRRTVVQSLSARSGPATVDQLAAAVAASASLGSDCASIDDAPTGDDHGGSNGDDRRRWEVALRHVHLPKLREAGLVDWDVEAAEVALTGWGERLSLRYAASDGTRVTFPNRQQLVK